MSSARGAAMRFAQDRHKPEGKWVQTTTVVEVVGVHHRLADARQFAAAARRAEKRGLKYGLVIEHQPNNPHDKNAIAVYGTVESRGWFGLNFGPQMREWHIGFLDRELAKELHRDLIANGLPIAAELYRIFMGDNGYLGFDIIVLAPPGHSMKKRLG